jgi:hypothetical protein
MVAGDDENGEEDLGSSQGSFGGFVSERRLSVWASTRKLRLDETARKSSI